LDKTGKEGERVKTGEADRARSRRLAKAWETTGGGKARGKRGDDVSKRRGEETNGDKTTAKREKGKERVKK
jgi:hypothetical protein